MKPFKFLPRDHALLMVVSILRTGLVFYGRDHSADGTILYRSVVDRLEMYLIFLWTGRYFQTCWTYRQLYSYVKLLYGQPGLGLHNLILWIGLGPRLGHFKPVML